MRAWGSGDVRAGVTLKKVPRHLLRRGELYVGAHARQRWRWWSVSVQWPMTLRAREDSGLVGSLVLELKTWLTDESMRGNLRRKVFVRWKFRAGLGAPIVPGPRGCMARGVKGQPCTWQQGHVPMLVTWPNREAPLEVAHSFACPKLAGPFAIVQEPRRALAWTREPGEPWVPVYEDEHDDG